MIVERIFQLKKYSQALSHIKNYFTFADDRKTNYKTLKHTLRNRNLGF